MRELEPTDLTAVLDGCVLNLLRRGADGSLRMSADRWRLAEVRPRAVVFQSVPAGPEDEQQVLEVPLSVVQRMTWDRLPKQQSRSQVRFHLENGDLLTFSGTLAEPG